MRIVVINPNSSQEMTENIAQAAKNYVRDRFEVITLPTQGAPEFIDYFQDATEAASGMIKIVKEYEDTADAFVVACHCDPNVELLRQITSKPVIGIGEASMRIAPMLGARFTVISTADHSVTEKKELIYKYGLEHYCASVRVRDAKNENELEAYLDAAKAAIKEDLAEVIVMGCAGLCTLAADMTKELHVPVLDGVVCGVMVAEGMARAGLQTSKIRLYAERQ